MNMNQSFVVAIAVGIVVGLLGALAIGWLRALVSRARAEKQIEPAPVKAKRSYKRKVTADGVAVTAITSSDATKKNRGRLAETKSSAKKKHTTAEAVDATKKRPGRPTNAEVAARQTVAAKLVKNNFEVGSSSPKDSVTTDHQLLLEKLINLSPEQLHVLATMSIGEAAFVPTKEILIT